jgi:hypothetical protein
MNVRFQSKGRITVWEVTNTYKSDTLPSFFFTHQTFMAHVIWAIAVNLMGWLRRIVDASTYVTSPPGKGTVSVMDAITPKPIFHSH